jgi:hypothetical protein
VHLATHLRHKALLRYTVGRKHLAKLKQSRARKASQ